MKLIVSLYAICALTFFAVSFPITGSADPQEIETTWGAAKVDYYAGSPKAAPPAAEQGGLEEYEEHLVVMLDPVPPEGGESQWVDFQSFGTFAQAISYATGGVILIPEGLSMEDAIAAFEDAMAQQDEGALPTTVIAIDYAWSGYRGSSLIWSASRGCAYVNYYYVNSMPGWNDRLSSTRGYAGCSYNMIYEHNFRGGAVRRCTPNCGSVGCMNNETSSRKWSRHNSP